VLDFGADNTGATECSAAIQAALDSGASSVFLPQGEYLVNSTMYIPAFVTLVGEAADVNQYTKATGGSVIIADTGAFSGANNAVIQIGQATELSSVGLMSVVVDIQYADAGAIGIRKENCNNFKMLDVWVLGSFSTSTQICYLNGNGTHGYFENIKLYGGKISCYMDNTAGRECHDSVYNKVWMYPHSQTGAICMYFPVDGGRAISTWIMPYFETSASGLTTGIKTENLAAPEMTMIYPSWDGTFANLWELLYPNRSKLIGSNLADLSVSFSGAVGRMINIGREGSQLIEKLYLYDVGSEVQFGVDSSGFNFGRISSGAAKISRIQGGKTTQVIGTVNSGSIFTDTVSLPNADVGDPVVIGMDWSGIDAYTLTAQVASSGTVRYWLQNNSGAPVDYGTRVLKVVGYNGTIT
jgi:hypothetical protein